MQDLEPTPAPGQSAPAPPQRERLALLLALPVLLAATIVAALVGFAAFDDEGWVINGARHLVEGARPYGDVVRNYYWPLFHAETFAVAWSFGANHTAFRAATAVLAWATTIGLYSLLRLGLRPLPAAAGALSWWAATLFMLKEALHPGWSTGLLVALAAHQVSRWAQERGDRKLLLAGICCGLALGFKPNVPVLAGLALGGSVLLSGGAPRWARGAWAAASCAALLVLVTPASIKFGQWPALASWVLLAGCAGMTLAPPVQPAGAPDGDARSGLRGLLVLMIGGAAGALAWLLPLLAWIDLGGWAESIRTSSSFAARYSIPIVTSWAAPAASAAFALGLVLTRARPARRALLLVGSSAAGAALVWGVLQPGLPQLAPATLMAGVLAVEVARSRRFGATGQVLAPLSVLLPFLGYPIAGAQLVQGALLVPSVIVMALISVAERPARAAGSGRAPSLSTLGSAALVACAIAAAARTGLNYLSLPPLMLPGSAGIRSHDAPALRAVVAAVRERTAEGTPIFTYPGMSSFYLWAERPGLIPYHFPDWTRAHFAGQLDRAQARLGSVPLVIVAPRIMTFWDGFERADSRPPGLRMALHREYTPTFAVGLYEIWLRRPLPPADPGQAPR